MTVRSARAAAVAVVFGLGLLTGCGDGGGTEPRPTSDPVPDSAAAWAAETFGTFEAVTFSGRGPERIELPPEVSETTFGIVRVTYDGTEPLLITSLPRDPDGQSMYLLDTTLGYMTADPGRFDGETAWWPANEPPAVLEIDGDGSWEMMVLPADAAPPLPDSGDGVRVYLYDGPGGDVTGLGSSTESGIAVTEYGAPSGSVRQATEPGRSGEPTPGTLSAGPSIVIVTHSDSWTLELP